MAGSLSDVIEQEFSRPAIWGECDCCMAVANVMREMCGFDPASDYRGRYSDKAGAYRLMGRGGVAATVARVCGDLGWMEVDPKEATDGDVGIRGLSTVIYCGTWLAKGEVGIIPVEGVKRAWRPAECA